MSSTFGKRLIYNASKWNGCKEDVDSKGVGLNRSACVDKIISYHTGQIIAIPWCQAFVSMILNETCKEFNVENPMPYTQSTHAFLNDAKRRGIRVDNRPATGSVGFIDWGKRGGTAGTGHTFFVNFAETTRVNTIEGNFGDQVNFGWRALTQVDAFIHVEDIGAGKTIGSPMFAQMGTGLKIATALVGGYLVWHNFLK